MNQAWDEPDKDKRREAMWARYGRPEVADQQTVLELTAGSHIAYNVDTVAWIYKNTEAVAAYEASNRMHAPGALKEIARKGLPDGRILVVHSIGYH
jgi:hypothetical protein